MKLLSDVKKKNEEMVFIHKETFSNENISRRGFFTVEGVLLFVRT
jgi:hypothetical protein